MVTIKTALMIILIIIFMPAFYQYSGYSRKLLGVFILPNIVKAKLYQFQYN